MADPRELDPEYDTHGGFPRLEVIDAPEGFGRFVTAMRRAQDLAVSAAGVDFNAAAARVDDLIELLAPHQAPGGAAPASEVRRSSVGGYDRPGVRAKEASMRVR